ncbi:hypothetical protein J6590_087734 [Homalodisca vitripennis]|nr:hypothetical protein J6590_087734 [Homalodisca vitripennis]
MRMVLKKIQIFLIKEIEILLNLCRDSSVKGEYGRTHIFKVWLSNPTVDLLLREEADVVNICNNRGISPLHLAELIESVIGKGFDFKNEVHGFPLLHQFVNIHFVSGVELLLKKGADLNYQDKEGRSPLHIAVCRQYIDITQMLLNKGAVVDIRNEEGETPLFCAVNMKLLFRQGANVNLKCHVCRPLHRDAVKMNEDIFDALLNHGANINERDGSGNTILHAAAARGFIYGIKTCLTRGVKVNERNFGGETPLHLAKSKEICEILLDSGALLEARDF